MPDPTPAPQLLTVSGLQKSYGDFVALQDISFSAKQGELVCIVGPSGCGKTTLLKCVAGLLAPSAGVVELDGVPVTAPPKKMAVVFQEYGRSLMPWMTVRRNVELPLLLTKLNRKERAERVHTALSVVGLADRTKHRPREMSGGQQQRVAIARAIVSDPNLLLCDEPTGDLDRQSADEILSILQLLNGELGKTIVMVTHDPAAANYAKRVLHLDKGRFVERELAA